MNDSTYGNERASEVLATILEKDKWYSKKVGILLAQYNEGVREVLSLKKIHFKRSFLTLWRNNAVERVDGTLLTGEIKRFTKNVIAAKYRKALHTVNGRKK